MALLTSDKNGRIIGGVSPYLQSEESKQKPISFNGGTDNVKTILWDNDIIYWSQKFTCSLEIRKELKTVTIPSFYRLYGGYSVANVGYLPFGGKVSGEVQDENGVWLATVLEKEIPANSGKTTVSNEENDSYYIVTALNSYYVYAYLTVYLNKEKTKSKTLTFKRYVISVNAGGSWSNQSGFINCLNYGYWNDKPATDTEEEYISSEIVKGSLSWTGRKQKFFTKLTATATNNLSETSEAGPSGSGVTIYKYSSGSTTVSGTITGLYGIAYLKATLSVGGTVYATSTTSTSGSSFSMKLTPSSYGYATSTTYEVILYVSADRNNWTSLTVMTTNSNTGTGSDYLNARYYEIAGYNSLKLNINTLNIPLEVCKQGNTSTYYTLKSGDNSLGVSTDSSTVYYLQYSTGKKVNFWTDRNWNNKPLTTNSSGESYSTTINIEPFD